jgi:hypothetical protein
MKSMKLLAVFVPVLLGMAAALWTPLALWYDMKEGLIVFLGFLAASLVQVMPLTANFLQSDRLSLSEAERLTASLTKQQHYWIGLLSATIAAMVIVIVGAALKDRVENLAPMFEHRWFLDISWSAVVCFSIVSSVSFVLMKMIGLFEGMLSLHRLRAELVINSAKRDAAVQTAAIQREAQVTAPLVPPDYGRIVRPH